jgi:DNA repair protein RadD
MLLRDYQQAAVDAVYQYLRDHGDNPAVVLPTAAGKSLCIAQIAKDAALLWQGRVLILAHVQELLEQNADKVQRLAPELNVGIYSAGLHSRDTLANVICGGIQSCYRKAGELGHFDLVIVDECHLIPESGTGMYRSLFANLEAINPNLRIIGFTATPHRLDSGPICGPDNILNAICYEVGVRELIVKGYLCPLISKAGKQKADFESLHIRGGEYVSSEVEKLMDDSALIDSACREILEYTRDRHSVLIFASGVEHGHHIHQTIERMGAGCRCIFGDTLEFDRSQTLADFKCGKLKYLVNVNVLTTGFDAPNVDCIAMLRPTLSPGLYYQMVGRGFRIHPSKQNCLVLDFGGNVMRHGPVDAVKGVSKKSGDSEAPAKECPTCHSVIAAGYAICPDCGHAFPPREKNKHENTASDAGVLTGQITIKTYPVQEIAYSVHTKRGAPADAPRTLRVDYRVGLNHWQPEWVCLEHSGFAGQKAEAWWSKRSDEPVPDRIEDACILASAGALREPSAITVKSVAGDDFDRIVGYEWSNDESLRPQTDSIYLPSDESIPF